MNHYTNTPADEAFTAFLNTQTPRTIAGDTIRRMSDTELTMLINARQRTP